MESRAGGGVGRSGIREKKLYYGAVGGADNYLGYEKRRKRKRNERRGGGGKDYRTRPLPRAKNLTSWRGSRKTNKT